MAKSYKKQGWRRLSRLRVMIEDKGAMDAKRAEKLRELEGKVDEANRKQM